jgi:ABC-type glycerol-3-phosphate transport system substrate-binding protein
MEETAMSNKSLSRRQFLRGAAFVGVGVPFLQACGSGPPAAEDSDSGAEAAAPSMEMTTVRYAQVIGPLDKQVDMFNEQSDTVHVEFELVPWGEHADKLLIDVAAGTAPDLWFIGGPWWIQIKRKKVALSISEFLANDPDVVMDNFEFPADSDWGMVDGDIYGLPTNSVILRGLAYSEKRFEEAGLDLPNENWTFADVAAAGPKLNRGEESYSMPAPLLAGDLYLTTIWQNGGQIINEDETKCLLDQPEAVEAIEQLVAWTEFSMKPGQHGALGDFPTASGKIAMWPMVLADWDSWLKVTANDETDQWMTYWPSVSNPPAVDVYAGSVHMEAIWSQSENIDAAWEFFIWRAINQDSLDYQITLFPINYRMEETVKSAITNERQADFLTLHLPITGRSTGEYWGPSTTEILNAFRSEYELAILGEKTTKEAMEAATKAIDVILEDT